MNPTRLEMMGTGIFALAVLHSFAVKVFRHLARKFSPGGVLNNFFELLGEIEVVFGLWAAVLVGLAILSEGAAPAIQIVEGRDFTEPLLVFAIMTVAATRPVLALTRGVLSGVSRLLPFGPEVSFLFVALTLGPLLGSLITEPAAMALTALLLCERYYEGERTSAFKYLLLATLLVNVSIGGLLTHFAAPPVLMVARIWDWDTPFMLRSFGWKVIAAVGVNATWFLFAFRKELHRSTPVVSTTSQRSPRWLSVLHVGFLAMIVLTSHHPALFIGLFLLFLGLAQITQEHQDELKIKESLLVGFFLAGLVVLGGLQGWWLRPLVAQFSEAKLFVGATLLSGFTDNAAVTYLGAQVPGVSASFKYALVAGAVAGGGLTVIANAPNPVAFAILRERFGDEGISPGRLFLAALAPTAVAMAFLWFA